MTAEWNLALCGEHKTDFTSVIKHLLMSEAFMETDLFNIFTSHPLRMLSDDKNLEKMKSQNCGH